MIVSGIGTDLVSIARIRKVLARYPERFPHKILHPGEHSQYACSNNKSRFLAKRFAAKEAVVKALGTGFRDIYATDIFIHNDARGRPCVKLDRTGETADQQVLVSIADEREYAVAYAMALKK